MNKFLSTLKSFAREEEGAQVVEYALVIAVISIGILLALKGTTNGIFANWITRVSNCLNGATCA